MKHRNIYYIFTGGSGNRGCEAIIRGTTELLKDVPGKKYAFTSGYEQEQASGLTQQIECLPLTCQHGRVYSMIRHGLCWLSYRFGSGRLQVKLIYEKIWNAVKKDDIYLVVGGDVYCYGRPYIYYQLNRILKNNRKALWGCSIEPSSIDEEMKTDLLGYDLIYARESITYNALIDAGITKNTVLLPDPAFAMPQKRLPLPEGFLEGKTIGVNLSPLIMNCHDDGALVLENYAAMIQDILETTDYRVALIPHVIWENSDDRKPLRELLHRFEDTGRVILLDAVPAEEIKGYISRCAFLVAARTHASIAAYSTCVPTLVVGYSVKARGIARDIFGTYEHYVIPVQSLLQRDDLTRAFRWIRDHEAQIRAHLQEFMPAYCQRAYLAAGEVAKLMDDD